MMRRKSFIDTDRLRHAIDKWGLALVNEIQLLREAIVTINIERKDEPIPHDDHIEKENDHLEARCLNCNNAKVCKEKHWEGCVYEPKYEKTCESCRHWKYIAKEWQCETTKCQGYEPKTELQTERSSE